MCRPLHLYFVQAIALQIEQDVVGAIELVERPRSVLALMVSYSNTNGIPVEAGR